jgi:hypothetical protein
LTPGDVALGTISFLFLLLLVLREILCRFSQIRSLGLYLYLANDDSVIRFLALKEFFCEKLFIRAHLGYL